MSNASTGTKRESSKSDRVIVKAKATRKEDGDSSSDEDENQPPKVKGMSRRPKIIVTPPGDEDDDSDEDLIKPVPKSISRKHVQASAAPRDGDGDSDEEIAKPARKAAHSKIETGLRPLQKAKAPKPVNTKPAGEDTGDSDDSTATLTQKLKTKRATKAKKALQKPAKTTS